MFDLFRIPTLRNSFWIAAGNVLMAGTSFIVSIIVIRNLGPSEFGILQKMIAYFTVIQTCENFINPNLFKRELLLPENNASELVSSFGILVSAFGLIGIVVTSILIYLGFLEPDFWMLVVMLLGMVLRISNGIAFYFDAHLKSLKGQISLNVGNISSAIYRIWISFLNPVALVQTWAVPLQFFVTAVVHFSQFKKEIPWRLPGKRTLNKLLELARESIPLFLSGFAEMMKARLPFIFLGMFALPADIGIYGSGVKLVEPWIFISSTLGVSFWPKLVQGKLKNPETHLKFIRIFFAANFYVFLPLVVLSLIFGGSLITWLLGDIYVEAIPVFQIQAITLLVVAATQAINLVELSNGSGKIILFRNVLSLIFMGLAVWPCYQSRGTVGIAYSVLMANVLSLLVMPLFFRDSFHSLRLYFEMIFQGPGLFFQEIRERRK
jgi:O-antigen/teichoic acid export membrane protein